MLRHTIGRFCYNVTNPKVMVDLCVVPMKETGGTSVSKEVAAVEKIIRSSGLKTQLHAYGTNIEGPWDEVFQLVKECHLELHNRHGVARITSSMRFGTRLDKESTIEGKMQSLEDKLA
eukprot:TRINITY_DN18375_c0_g1_i2.p1 TRINITY_DN18375_c0_g1~~TRINITY_DN18375_c0_g1_i2.p1  ORF type:complete len:130 (+),score=31.98 TRINITY_DN18375_c0_g1_i2:37-390(+)